MLPVFKQAKTFHALDSVATVIGYKNGIEPKVWYHWPQAEKVDKMELA
jgi:hypothetical protein